MEKKCNFWILFLCTFCLIVSWVFVIETITGSQIKDFCPRVWNLCSDLRKKYPADGQIMFSSTCQDIERTPRMSKFGMYSSFKNRFWQWNIKFQNICVHWFHCQLFRNGIFTCQNLRYFKISRKVFFWKGWNWERMQRMTSVTVLNGHSGKPVWKFIWFWSTGMPGTHYPIT